MAKGTQKYSTNEAVAFILVSGSESNYTFDDESRLEPSDIYDSEEKPFCPGMEVDKIQENDQQYVTKVTTFVVFWYM